MTSKRSTLGVLGALVALVLLTSLAAAASAIALPAGWAYELVSPPNTNGIDIIGGISSVDGNTAWLRLIVPVSPDQATGSATTYMATRGTSGWQSHDLADPTSHGVQSAALAIGSRDGSAALVHVCQLEALECLGPESIQRVTNDGSRTTMLTSVPIVPLGWQTPDIVDGSADLSSIVFQVAAGEPALLSGDTHSFGRGLYRSTMGSLQYLGLDEHDHVLDCGAALASNPPGGQVGAGFDQTGVSADTSTVVFASPDPIQVAAGSCPGPVDLYVRDGDTTVNISAPRISGRTDEGATFAGSTRDGSTVYFVTRSQLAAGDNDTAVDLYEYHVGDDSLTRLTAGADIPTDFLRPSVQVSSNGDDIYFVAMNALGGQGTNSNENMFRYHDGTTQLIASTNAGFIALGQPYKTDFPSPLTPDGNHLVFYSNAPLGGAVTGGNFELFDYNALTDGLSCITCRSDGPPPSSFMVMAGDQINTRAQSDDGSTVVFDSGDSLTPQDVNGMRDVYMWRDGSLSLVSSGRGTAGSFSNGISADGHTVFFTTLDRLTDETTQATQKMYVARLGGGFHKPSPTPACTDDACQGLPTSPPALLNPTSTTFTGAGNVKSPVVGTVTSKPLTKAQKLSKALKKCKTKHRKSQRKKCEASARKRFGRRK
jgi:hypothetical protein